MRIRSAKFISGAVWTHAGFNRSQLCSDSRSDWPFGGAVALGMDVDRFFPRVASHPRLCYEIFPSRRTRIVLLRVKHSQPDVIS